MRGIRESLVALALGAALFQCAVADGPEVFVHVSPDLDPGAVPAVRDLVADLERISGKEVLVVDLEDPPCNAGEVRILVLGHQHAEDGERLFATDLARQEYVVDEQRCGSGGRRIVLRGGSLLAGQWAIYDLMEQLGVRYFHPEHTYYPDELVWPAQPIRVRAEPSMWRRSMHAHRTHPIELSPPRVAWGIDMVRYQRRWIDWNIKLRQTSVDGWDERFVGSYPYERGFGRTVGLNLANAQQGFRPVLDPDDPRSEREQLAAAVDAVMRVEDGGPAPFRIGVQFNPSEFTEADDVRTVERLTYLTEYVTETYPGVQLVATNHGTAQEPTPTLGVRFFDLPQFAPPQLGVQVHPLMFYDLERPAAGVYGNADFGHLREWIVEQQAVRRVVYYPEASWWLTFDLPVPLYLAPVTLDARRRDLELLTPYLSPRESDTTGVWGHHLFTSGQEWGYWMVDYCVAKMAWDVAYTDADCYDDVTAVLARGDEIAAVLGEVAARQARDLRDPEILRYLVGSDDETEAAAEVGIELHPLPPAPAELLGWSDRRARVLEIDSLGPLRDIAADYHAWADRVEATLPVQSETQAPWVREIRDGLRVFALRAEHAVAVYQTALALRAAVRAEDADAIERARGGLAEARAITDAAREVVRARELDYRYQEELTIAGDEPGTAGAIPNETIYPYRYLSRTHRMFYWTRPDEQLAALFDDPELAGAGPRIVAHGTPVAAEGADEIVVVSQRHVFARGSFDVVAPEGADLVEGILPGFVVGLGDGGDGAFMVLGRIDGDAPVAAPGSLVVRDRDGARSGPADMQLALGRVGTLTVFDAEIEIAGAAMTIAGDLGTDELVATLVSVGGFDAQGARELIARVLGYTVATLPARVSFEARSPAAAE